MAPYTITVTSMDGLELKKEIQALSDAAASLTQRLFQERANRLTADDLMQIDFEPADGNQPWVADREVA